MKQKYKLARYDETRDCECECECYEPITVVVYINEKGKRIESVKDLAETLRVETPEITVLSN